MIDVECRALIVSLAAFVIHGYSNVKTANHNRLGRFNIVNPIPHLGILLLLGTGVLGGALGAWFFQRIKLPQVVGYILFGILIGQSGIGLVRAEDIQQLQSFTWFALGLIGFLVGGELRGETFRKYGKQFISILMWEGILAFLLVMVPITLIIYKITGLFAPALAGGIVFGAIASATDPASTVDVLWEYRAKGVLTSAIIAVVALDDALAMTLYGLGTSVAQMLVGEDSSLTAELKNIGIELFGSVLAGLAAGGIMIGFLHFLHHQKKERMLAIAAGMLLLVIGAANAAGLDVILVTMAMGVLLVNFAPIRSEELFAVIKSFSVPIYVMFFVLVGARLTIAAMPLWLWGIVIVYVLGRNFGKMAGCWIGAKMSGAAPAVQHYGGLGLFAQGGVAIGLSIMATEHLGNLQITEDISLGELIIFGVTATTMIVQLAGPPMVKLSIRLAGEIGRNVTEADIIQGLKVENVMIKDVEPIRETDLVRAILEKFSKGEYSGYPVVDSKGNLKGLLTLGHLKDILVESECWEWLVAADMLGGGVEYVTSDTPLAEALDIMDKGGLEQVPVVCQGDRVVPVGMLDSRHVEKIVEQELIRIQAGVA